MKLFSKHCRSGLTLVELLVVITLMTIVTALIVPRIRTVNKDRNIREAARVVGSTLSLASQNGVSDQVAGVIFERNPNFAMQTRDGNNVFYYSSRMFLMRSVPNYIGDNPGATADVVERLGGNNNERFVCTIDRPYEMENSGSERQVIRQNDFIRFDNSVIRYRIAQAPQPSQSDPNKIEFRLEHRTNGQGVLIDGIPEPPQRSGMSFVIERQPRKVESSVVELPEGYYVDFRYSGNTDQGDFDMDGTDEGADGDIDTFSGFALAGDDTDLVIYFDDRGGADRILYNDGVSLTGVGSIYFFITEFDPQDAVAITTANPNARSLTAANLLLSKPSSLWVSLNITTGGVNVAYTVPQANVASIDDVFTAIIDCRGGARDRIAARQ